MDIPTRQRDKDLINGDLTPTLKRTLDLIVLHLMKCHKVPTQRETAKMFNFKSQTAAQSHFERLCKIGYLKSTGKGKASSKSLTEKTFKLYDYRIRLIPA